MLCGLYFFEKWHFPFGFVNFFQLKTVPWSEKWIIVAFFPRKMMFSLWFRRFFQVEKCSLWSKINVLWNYAYEKWHFPFSLIDFYQFKREPWSEKIYCGFFSLEKWHFLFDSVDFFKLKSYPWSEKIIVAILFSLPKKILEFRSLCFPVGFVDFSSWKVPNP